MRRAKENELRQLADFMIEQFYEKEELQMMFAGFDPTIGKKIAQEMLYFELLYFYDKGDILVYDDEISGVIVGIDAKKLFSLRRILLALKANQVLKELSKDEILRLKENSKIIQKVHSFSWFKKYGKKLYYIAQFGIDKSKRGHGIARKMLEFVFEQAKEKAEYVVLETFTFSNVAIYEHFGFEQKEVNKAEGKEFAEYRMIKKLEK